MNILVIGCGYVGLSIATLLSKETKVRLWDNNKNKLANIQRKVTPFKDDTLIKEWETSKQNFEFPKSFAEAIKDIDTIFISVSTDFINETRSLDTQNIENIIKDIVQKRVDFQRIKIFIKSTVPIGFTEYLINKYKSKNIYYFPEFLREGSAYHDLLYPDRYVIGGYGDEMANIIKLLRKCSNNYECPALFMGPSEAESVKLFSNAYLALRIAFFNELDTFAETKNLSARNIINGLSYDSRIGNYYNNPSFGYGGYCLTKDTKQLATNFKNIKNNIISNIDKSNELRIQYTISKIKNKNINTIGVYRLICKSNTDNFRQSVMVKIMDELIKCNKKVLLYEPLISTLEKNKNVNLIKNLQHFGEQSELILANRIDDNILRYNKKIYTRDLFSRD